MNEGIITPNVAHLNVSIVRRVYITFPKYDCIIVHKAYYLFTCTCVSINSFHSHSMTIYIDIALQSTLSCE